MDLPLGSEVDIIPKNVAMPSRSPKFETNNSEIRKEKKIELEMYTNDKK